MAKKKKKVTATQRKLKNARERAKYRLEKMGFASDQISYLLQDFRKVFANKAGKINIGKLTNKQIDRRISDYTLQRGGVKVTYQDLLDRVRDYLSYTNMSPDEIAEATYYLFNDAFQDTWQDNYNDAIAPQDLNSVLRDLYSNLYGNIDRKYWDSIKDSIDTMIKDMMEANIK